MATFIVTTEETVKGTYIVQADSEPEAREQFEGHRIEWGRVEQTSYEAFLVEIESVEGVTNGQAEENQNHQAEFRAQRGDPGNDRRGQDTR